MNYLVPIYDTPSGAVYAIKSDLTTEISEVQHYQFHIGDTAIMMTLEDLSCFSKVIERVKGKKQCDCPNCSHGEPYKVIKCDTPLVTLRIKATPKVLKDVEEMVSVVLFQAQYEKLLLQNDLL